MHGNCKDLTGEKFDRLTVMSLGPSDTVGHARWWCLCDCGEGKLVSATHLKTRHIRSCGCLNIEIATERAIKIGHNQQGKKHWNWKGGITTENMQVRNSVLYKTWRTQVFERDWHTCQKCRTYGGKLNAHHIEDFSSNLELRAEVSNGVTLCKDCHKDFHHQYGRGNNTRKQLVEFMGEQDEN